jgi:hypothetical protein
VQEAAAHCPDQMLVILYPILGKHRLALLFKQIHAPIGQSWKNAEMSRK